ncbi:MAG: hypothetical protein IJ121_06910 [Eubacterium sp.]|nr:hypothetical protein [Eubacterium sp.]
MKLYTMYTHLGRECYITKEKDGYGFEDQYEYRIFRTEMEAVERARALGFHFE